MATSADVPTRVSSGLADCWNSIGIRGDHSCPSLVQYVHCRNCPVYSAAAVALLDGELSDAAVREQTDHFAVPRVLESAHVESIVVFRVAAEWLALPMSMVAEVAEMRPIRTVPHRRSGLVLGVANVRGELLVCISLARLIGLDRAGDAPGDPARAARQRLIVVLVEDVRVVVPVDEVAGIHHVSPDEMKDVPTLVARAPSAYSRAVVSWSGRSVGLLDGERLARVLKGGLS
jgi:chemotaxis-related protein WspD